jgi:PAS domain S-box-containing protein
MVFAEADIPRAFEDDEFFPVFQPLVELRTGQLAGFEILARWKHGQLGMIMPDAFIPALEKSGLIDKLTRTLLEKAFSSPLLADRVLTLAVNISPSQLLGPDMPKRLADVAGSTGFALDRLIIEITESALVDDLCRAKAVAGELKTLGCRLALDDFGTGYSSLKHLHALPFDELKVDRSFVSSMTEKRESRKIVASVLGLGHSLGLLTVAEGVETQDQANMLLWLGCDVGQGWLHGKPAPAEELPSMIAEARWNGSVGRPVPMGLDPMLSLEALPAQRLAQLQAIYDGAPVGLCFLDRKMRYVSLNRQLAQMNGVPAAEHLGRAVAEVIPHVFPTVEPFIRSALQGEPVAGVEIQRPRADENGETRILMASYQPARDEAGEVIGVVVALMDITKSKRIEEALRESENHYRHMVQLSPHVPWVLNAKGEVTDASPRWESLTGQTLEEALGNGWQKALHPDDVEPTREAIQYTLRTGEPIDVEYRVRKPGGEWTWIRARGAPRFGPFSEVVSVYGVVEEVHGQKQISEELAACHTELRAAINAVPEGILLVDSRDGRIFMVNPAAKEIFGNAVFPGQKLSEYTRLPITDADGQPLKPDQFPIVRATLHGETVDGVHIFFLNAVGSRIPLMVSGKPIRSDDGQLIGGLLLIQRSAGKDLRAPNTPR